jgi:hypothetical protein
MLGGNLFQNQLSLCLSIHIHVACLKLTLAGLQLRFLAMHAPPCSALLWGFQRCGGVKVTVGLTLGAQGELHKELPSILL